MTAIEILDKIEDWAGVHRPLMDEGLDSEAYREIRQLLNSLQGDHAREINYDDENIRRVVRHLGALEGEYDTGGISNEQHASRARSALRSLRNHAENYKE